MRLFHMDRDLLGGSTTGFGSYGYTASPTGSGSYTSIDPDERYTKPSKTDTTIADILKGIGGFKTASASDYINGTAAATAANGAAAGKPGNNMMWIILAAVLILVLVYFFMVKKS